MSCVTCGHTMQAIGRLDDNCTVRFWCPRCGTISATFAPHKEIGVPLLVGRCRDFRESAISGDDDGFFQGEWHRLGIEESIRPPTERSLP